MDIHMVSNLVDIRRLTLRSITDSGSDSVDLEESEPTHRTTSRDSGVGSGQSPWSSWRGGRPLWNRTPGG
jgi:hypothetical protein